MAGSTVTLTQEGERYVLCNRPPRMGNTLLKCKLRGGSCCCCFEMHENSMEERDQRVRDQREKGNVFFLPFASEPQSLSPQLSYRVAEAVVKLVLIKGMKSYSQSSLMWKTAHGDYVLLWIYCICVLSVVTTNYSSKHSMKDIHATLDLHYLVNGDIGKVGQETWNMSP